jgi:hypothetical protein
LPQRALLGKTRYSSRRIIRRPKRIWRGCRARLNKVLPQKKTAVMARSLNHKEHKGHKEKLLKSRLQKCPTRGRTTYLREINFVNFNPPKLLAWGERYSNIAWFCIGGLSFVLYVFLSRLGLAGAPSQITPTLQQFFIIMAALFLLWFCAVLMIKTAQPRQRDRWPLISIFAFAALFRFALLEQTPWLSNDIYRYLWDAQLLDRGVSPYAFPPAAEALADFRDATIYPKMDHKTVHSVYPPFLQILFWSGLKTSRIFALQPATGLKLIFTLADLGLVFFLFHLLARINIDPRWAMLYAWHPLPIIEIAGSGHTDGVGALTLVLVLAFLLQRKYFMAVIFLALGFLVKFITVMFLPFLLVAVWKEANLKKAGGLAALFVLLILLSYAPFATAGEKLISGLLLYSEKWRFNDGFFSLIFSGIHRILPDGLVTYLMIPPGWEINTETLTTRRIDLALNLAKTISGAIFLFIYSRLLWRLAKAEGGDRHWPAIIIIILVAFFLLSPTLQPWYLIWLLPFLCLREMLGEYALVRRMISPLWMLSATVFLSYSVLENYIGSGVWQEPSWVKWVEYGIPLLSFVVAPLGAGVFKTPQSMK